MNDLRCSNCNRKGEIIARLLGKWVCRYCEGRIYRPLERKLNKSGFDQAQPKWWGSDPRYAHLRVGQ